MEKKAIFGVHCNFWKSGSSFEISKDTHFIVNIFYTEEDEELGLDATQHDEKYGRNPLKA